MTFQKSSYIRSSIRFGRLQRHQLKSARTRSIYLVVPSVATQMAVNPLRGSLS